MVELNRRQFVAAAVSAVCAGAASCAGPGDNGTPAGVGPTDVGPLSGFTRDGVDGAFVKRGHFLLVRDGGRLYALSSVCTHESCDVKAAGEVGPSGPALLCPCHGSRFGLDGAPFKGPARRPLPRLGISADAGGRVVVDPSRRFGPGDWADPASFVAVG